MMLGVINGSGRAAMRWLPSLPSGGFVCVRCAAASTTASSGRRLKWEDRADRDAFLERVATRMGITDAAGWRDVTLSDIKALPGGNSFMSYYANSMAKALEELRPETRGQPTQAYRRKMPRGYWEEPENQRLFLESLKEKMGVEKDEDWRYVTNKDVLAHGGGALLVRHSHSLTQALIAVYGESIDVLRCRGVMPRGFWQKAENRRMFFERVEKEMQVESEEGWAKVTRADIQERGGGGLLAMYNFSIRKALQDTFPERNFQDSCRPRLSNRFWYDAKNQKQFVEEFEAAHGIEKPEDWAKVTNAEVVAYGSGSSVLQVFGSSISRMLAATRPDWSPILGRVKTRKDHWESWDNVVEFLEKVKAQLRIKGPEDWARLSRDQVRELRGDGFLRQYTLADAVRKAYPDEEWQGVQWDGEKRAKKKANQRQLLVELSRIFEGQQQQHVSHAE